MAAFVRLVLRHRWTVLALILATAVIAGWSARRVRFQFQFRDFYDYPSNPDLPALQRANADFGDPAGHVVVLVRAADVFRPEVLEFVRDVADDLGKNPRFSRVDSLTNVRAIRARGDEIVTGALADPVPTAPRALAEIRAFALADPSISNRIVSRDGRVTAILAELATPAAFATIAEQRAALDGVERVLSAHPAPPGVSAAATGTPAIEVETTRVLVGDQLRLVPAVIAVIVLALFGAFRSLHGIVLGLASVATATLWTAGLFARIGRPVDIVGSVIPITILVYGVVDPIFVLTRFLQKVDAGEDRDAAIVNASSELALPCFLTSLTTALGFAAFVTSSAPTVRFYGFTVAIGVALSWVTTITLLPVLLSLAAPPKGRRSNGALTRFIDRALVRIWAATRSRLAVVLAGTAALLAAGAVTGARARVANEYVGSLPRGEVQAEVRELERSLAGVVRFVVYLHGKPGAMQRPEVLSAMERIERAARGVASVNYTSSLAAVVAQTNQAFMGGDTSERRVPESHRLVAQYLALLAPQDRVELVSDDFSRAQIAVLGRDEGSAVAAATAQRLKQAVDQSGIERLGIQATLTGAGIAAYRGLDRVVSELALGFVAAFAIVLVLAGALFRSVRVAAISAVPNLIPVALCFVTLRALSLNLRMDSALVLGISIGGLFNTTIHLAARIRQLDRAGQQAPDEAVGSSLRAVGPAALFTSGILSAGFSVLMLSRFPGLQILGVLSMVTLVSAVVADIVVSPVLFRRFLRFREGPLLSAPPVVASADRIVAGE